MKNINVSISDLEYKKLGLKGDQLPFAELVALVSKELTRQTLNQSIELAEKYGLSTLTMEDIDKEVKAARKHAKGNN